MVEKTANVGMMKGLRSRGVAVSLGNFRIRHESLDQRFQVMIIEAFYKSAQRLPELSNVFCRLRKEVGEFNLRIAQPTQLVNRKLKAVLVLVDEALDLDVVVLIEGVERIVDVVPHLGFNQA